MLRIARSLTLAHVPQKRITRALKQLRQRLPATAPLSGLNVRAVAGQVVVEDRTGQWESGTGQYLLELDVKIEGSTVTIVERQRAAELAGKQPGSRRPVSVDALASGDSADLFRSTSDADELFERALGMEDHSPGEALRFYKRCIQADPSHLGARINCGRLLQETGRLAAAEKLYMEGLKAGDSDPTLLFNLGVLLEDRGRLEAAVGIYQRTLSLDPDFADAHYNLARLHEKLGRPQHALRHLGCYRRLTTAPD